jgi:hypothetical protein
VPDLARRVLSCLDAKSRGYLCEVSGVREVSGEGWMEVERKVRRRCSRSERAGATIFVNWHGQVKISYSLIDTIMRGYRLASVTRKRMHSFVAAAL